jgi:predicted methyltransferase
MIRRCLIAAAALMAVAGPVLAQDAPSPTVAAAIADASRPAEDREKDADRKAAETLAFTGVQPGWRVGDMMTGGGYFARLFSAAVGPEGHVTATQPAEFIARFPAYGEGVAKVDALANADGVAAPMAAPAFPQGLDLVFTAQNYHDLHLDAFPADTAGKVNERVFEALKPGGVYVIVDHAAPLGSGIEAAGTLHRIDPEQVKREVEAAGFVLDAEGDALHRADDPMTSSVFDPAIRGHTSQFMLRFKKPG